MTGEQTKSWWQSKTFLTGCTIILLSISEAIINGLSWREVAGTALGAAVVVFRTVATKRLVK